MNDLPKVFAENQRELRDGTLAEEHQFYCLTGGGEGGTAVYEEIGKGIVRGVIAHNLGSPPFTDKTLRIGYENRVPNEFDYANVTIEKGMGWEAKSIINRIRRPLNSDEEADLQKLISEELLSMAER